MRRLALVWLFVCIAAGLANSVGIPLDEYRARRATLRKSLDGTVLLFGKTTEGEGLFGFFQEPNFYYLTGWNEPGAVLLLTRSSETLFLPHRNERAERYVGRRAAAEDANVRAATGFDSVMPIERLESQLGRALDSAEEIYTLRGGVDRLKSLLALREPRDASPLIAKLRVIKSPGEIAAIQRATDVSVLAHKAAWKRMASGTYEYQIAATLSYIYLENGCERPAYGSIVGSGPNGTILHYGVNRRRMDAGEVTVIDAAAECAFYASDITRTVPVSGKFTAREREIYNIVLGAQKAAIAAIKPGIRLRGESGSLHKIALDYINSHGKDGHGAPLGKYFVHGLGHQVGLEVHDPDPDLPLAPGMVITIEPGVYIPEEGIGVRIEDTVLVTENGARVMSAALPKEPEEVEQAVGR